VVFGTGRDGSEGFMGNLLCLQLNFFLLQTAANFRSTTMLADNAAKFSSPAIRVRVEKGKHFSDNRADAACSVSRKKVIATAGVAITVALMASMLMMIAFNTTAVIGCFEVVQVVTHVIFPPFFMCSCGRISIYGGYASMTVFIRQLLIFGCVFLIENSGKIQRKIYAMILLIKTWGFRVLLAKIVVIV
jgi:hypothetical protein